MSHADTLRALASGTHPGLSYSAVVALIAGVEALDTLDRVRAVLTDLRDDYLAHIADHDEATVTHMCYCTAADDLTNILEGETE